MIGIAAHQDHGRTRSTGRATPQTRVRGQTPVVTTPDDHRVRRNRQRSATGRCRSRTAEGIASSRLRHQACLTGGSTVVLARVILPQPVTLLRDHGTIAAIPSAGTAWLRRTLLNGPDIPDRRWSCSPVAWEGSKLIRNRLTTWHVIAIAITAFVVARLTGRTTLFDPSLVLTVPD